MTKGPIQGFVGYIASRSNTVLVILLLILALNFFVIDPIPFIDEIISIPVIMVIIAKFLRWQKFRYSNNKNKSETPKDHIDTSKAEEGEIQE